MAAFNCQTENDYETDMMVWFMSGEDTSDVMAWTHRWMIDNRCDFYAGSFKTEEEHKTMERNFEMAGCTDDLKESFNRVYAESGPMEFQDAWMNWMTENCENHHADGWDKEDDQWGADK
jgi:hypothetical protein